MAVAHPPKPLVSTRANDPDAEEAIEVFVVTLGETIDHLQDAEAGADWALLRGGAEALAARADELGYAPMGAVARALVDACRTAEAEAAHKAVEEITELAKRIRRGHRSAA